MRPIKLEIAGLQSFEKKQSIDFEYLSEYGLFGIFGPTGSGKSTILDAITLALYGEVVRIKSASKQDTLDDLININSNEIYVKFSFGIGTDIYTIERIFKCKKNQRIIASKKVLMLKNSDVIADKISEINLEINNIIGLSMDDFTRSVILPQGKFSDFLKLTGVERRSMLERLFDLEAYGRSLLNKIKEKRNFYLKEISAIDNQIKGKGEVSLDLINNNKEKISTLTISCEKLNKSINELELLIKKAEEIINLQNELTEYKTRFDEIEMEKEKIEIYKISLENNEKAEKVNNKYETFKIDHGLFLEKEALKNKLLPENFDLQEKLNNINNNIEILKTNKKEIISEIDKNKISKDKLETISKIKINLNLAKKLEENLIITKKELSCLEEKLNLLNLRIEELNIKNKDLEKERTGIQRVETKEIFDLEKQLYELNIKEILDLEENINKSIRNLEKNKVKKMTLENQIQNLEQKQKKYQENILIKLASELKEGEACILCGSKEHPHIFHGELSSSSLEDLSSNIIELKSELNSINLKTLEEELNLYRNKLNNRSSKNSLALETSLKENIKNLTFKQEINQKIYEEITKQLEKQQKDLETLFNEKLSLEENIKNKIESFEDKQKELSFIRNDMEKINSNYIENTKIIYANIEISINDFEKEYEYFENLEKKIKKLEDEILDLENNKQDLYLKNDKIQREIESINGELIHLERIQVRSLEEYKELLSEFNYENIESVKNNLLDEKSVKEFKSKIENYEATKIKIINAIAILEEKLEGRQVDKEIYDKNLQELKAQIEEKESKNKDLTRLHAEQERLEKLSLELEVLLLERETNNIEYIKYEDLAKLFEGNKFVEFLALGKIRSISKSAGRRLSKISNGRYGLGTDKLGNFLIIDNFNGGEMRKSSTLSGGESFLVSLSLALALSAQIQLKGQTQLEFFFLDEGFGTLDANLLDKVISSLENLREKEGMKIGLISHVEELKERIPRKIELIPPVSGEEGSRIKFI